jgi:uncharacterized damage-inducible protein DinB
MAASSFLGGSPLAGQEEHAHGEHDQMSESGIRAELIKDLSDVAGKMVGLAEAIPQSSYSYRPMEGVRSASEVFMHLAAANYMLPSLIGTPVPAEAGFSMETMGDYEKIADREHVLAALKGSFEHMQQVIESTPDSELNREITIFGQPGTVRSFFILSCNHAHEHLGQMIAYARSNQVVPPWSGMTP